MLLGWMLVTRMNKKRNKYMHTRSGRPRSNDKLMGDMFSIGIKKVHYQERLGRVRQTLM